MPTLALSKSNKLFAIITVIVVLSIATGIGSYFGWIHGADHRDFYPWWAGSRFAIFEGRDPYSAETTRLMQITLYGAPIPPGQDQQGFAYPAHMMVVLFPLWFIPDVEIAAAVWVGISAGLLVASLSVLRTLNKQFPVWAIVLLLMWLFPLITLFQAQIGALTLASVALAIYAYHNRQDVLAGCLLAVGTIKPQLVILPVLVLTVLSLKERRFKLVGGLAVSGLILFALSIALTGWWVPRWLARLTEFSGYAANSWAPSFLLDEGLIPAALGAILLITVLALARWSKDWVVQASLPLSFLLLPQTLFWNLIMLLVPMVLSWRGAARWGVISLWIIGWLSLVGYIIVGAAWWKWQNILIPLLTLGVIAWASHLNQPAQLPAESSTN